MQRKGSGFIWTNIYIYIYIYKQISKTTVGILKELKHSCSFKIFKKYMRILMDTTGNDEGPIVLFDCLKGLYNPLQATSATLADL